MSEVKRGNRGYSDFSVSLRFTFAISHLLLTSDFGVRCKTTSTPVSDGNTLTTLKSE